MSDLPPLTPDDRLAMQALAKADSSGRDELAEALTKALAEIGRMDKMLAREWKDPFSTVVEEIGTTPSTPRGYDAVVTIVADEKGATRVRCTVREYGQTRRKFDLTGELAAYTWPLIRAAARFKLRAK